MKKENIVKEAKSKPECKINIEIKEDGIETTVVVKGGTEQIFADFLTCGFINVGKKILRDTGVPADLQAKIFGRWLGQISKGFEGLDFDDLDD